MTLVDPEVTRRKIDREIELWNENAEIYRRRGWVLLGRNGESIDVAFLADLPLGGRSLPIVAAATRLDYSNYDLWPPSVEFIEPTTGALVPPLTGGVVPTPDGPRNLLVGNHPDTGRPFFCVPGIRQYHQHPQHSGDSWLLHRSDGAGSLATICDRIWRAMARPLIGLQVQMLTLPPQSGQQLKIQFELVSGDVDAMASGQPQESGQGDQK